MLVGVLLALLAAGGFAAITLIGSSPAPTCYRVLAAPSGGQDPPLRGCRSGVLIWYSE
jgi:hypothetical protein